MIKAKKNTDRKARNKSKAHSVTNFALYVFSVIGYVVSWVLLIEQLCSLTTIICMVLSVKSLFVVCYWNVHYIFIGAL